MRISDVIELCLEPRPASAEVVLKPFGIQSNDGLLGTVAFTQIDTVTIAGNVVSDFTHTPANGTYTVNSDCTGTFTINFTDGRPTVIVNFVVVGGSRDRHRRYQRGRRPGHSRHQQHREKAASPSVLSRQVIVGNPTLFAPPERVGSCRNVQPL